MPKKHTKRRETESKSAPATLAQKNQAHEMLDILWKVSAFSEEQKQGLRSLIYQLWAAVLLAEDGFYVAGVKDPFAGNHHISSLPLRYHDQLKGCLKYILNQNDNNTSKLAFSLVRWYSPIKNLNEESEIINYVNQDQLILKIREYIGLSKVEQSSEQQDLTDEESDKKEKSEEIVKIKINKKSLEKSPQDIFIDALFLDILGKKDEATALYEEAENMGYDEDVADKKNSEENRMSARCNIMNSIYANKILLIKQINPDLAFEYTKKMAEKKVPQAMFDLARDYQHGFNVEKNPNIAEKLLNEAEKLGYSLAGSFKRCYFGNITQEDWRSILESSPDQDNSYIQFGFALLYASEFKFVFPAKEDAVKKDLDKAFEYLRLSVKQANPLAIKFVKTESHRWSTDYFQGNGVELNSKKAIAFLEISAELGSTISYYLLGMAYKGEYGIEPDYDKAFQYLKIASDKGNIDARKELGIVSHDLAILHLTGSDKVRLGDKFAIDLEKIRDFDKAIEFAQISSEAGFKRGSDLFSKLKEQKRLNPRKPISSLAEFNKNIKLLGKLVNLEEVSESVFQDIEKLYESCCKYISANKIILDTEQSKTIKRCIKDFDENFLEQKDEVPSPSVIGAMADPVVSKDKSKLKIK